MRPQSFPRVSRTHWVAYCWRNLPPSGAGKISLPDHTIYLLSLPIKRWQSTVLGGLRSLIRKNCDLAYHCAVSENVRGTACRGSRSSPSSISDLSAESESYESPFQARPSYTANLFCSDQPRLSSGGNFTRRRNRVVLDRFACGL